MKCPSSHKRQRKLAGTWLKGLRAGTGLTQMELAERRGFKYYSFASQVETLISFYEPELHRLLYAAKPCGS